MSSVIDTRSAVLLIENDKDSQDLTQKMLGTKHRVKVAVSAEQGLKLAKKLPYPEVIIFSDKITDMLACDLIKKVKSTKSLQEVPIILITDHSDEEKKEDAISFGAADFLFRPISPSALVLRVDNQILLKRANEFLHDQNNFLVREIERRSKEIQIIQDVTIVAMASLAETRDNETGFHIKRTQWYVKELALKLQTHEKFASLLTPDYIDLLFKSAPLHDIGKVGIPDHILLKPGKYTPAEFKIMERHTTIGRDAILAAENKLHVPNSFLTVAREIAYSHQEKWDGSGYPLGLKGEEIPVSARLMAVADVYDALISARVYKPPFSHEEAVKIISDGAGKHFDPDMIEAFLQIEARFKEISSHFADNEMDGTIPSLKI